MARYAWSYNCFGSDPYAIVKGNGLRDEVERGLLVIMITAEQQGTLRNAHMASDSDGVQVIDPDILANPYMITNNQPPRVFNGHMRLDNYAFANF